MTKLEALRAALKNATDESEIERLNNEILEAIHEDAKKNARLEVEKEYEEKFQAEKEKAAEAEQEKEHANSKVEEIKRAQKAGHFSDDARLKVESIGDYRGMNLRRAKAVFTESMRKKGRTGVLERVEQNPDGFERLAKAFTDMVHAAPEAQHKDLIEGTDASGGYLVNDDDRDELLAYARDDSVALRRCRIVRMNSDVVTYPREDGKVNLTFTDEDTAMNETSATFGQITLTAEDLDGYADVSIHLEQDNSTPGGIVGVLLDQFTEAYGQKIDQRVFEGASVASSVFDEAGLSVVLSNSAFSAITLDDLRSVIGKLRPNRRRGAVWFGEYSVIWDHIFGIQEDSKSVFVPDPRNPAQFRILGYPLEEVVEAPSTDGASKYMAGFGNLMGYHVGERLNTLTLFRDPYTQRHNKRIRYSFLTRVAFQMALPNLFVKIVTGA
jgi:HK97 family phage major capsid protein